MLLVLILLLLLLGGGGGYYGYSRWGAGGGIGIFGLILIILVVYYLVGGAPVRPWIRSRWRPLTTLPDNVSDGWRRCFVGTAVWQRLMIGGAWWHSRESGHGGDGLCSRGEIRSVCGMNLERLPWISAIVGLSALRCEKRIWRSVLRPLRSFQCVFWLTCVCPSGEKTVLETGLHKHDRSNKSGHGVR